MTIETMLMELAAALPEKSKQQYDEPTIRDVCLTLREDGSWECLAGGHHAVALGEWSGDFAGRGNTAEEAISECFKKINEQKLANSIKR